MKSKNKRKLKKKKKMNASVTMEQSGTYQNDCLKHYKEKYNVVFKEFNVCLGDDRINLQHLSSYSKFNAPRTSSRIFNKRLRQVPSQYNGEYVGPFDKTFLTVNYDSNEDDYFEKKLKKKRKSKNCSKTNNLISETITSNQLQYAEHNQCEKIKTAEQIQLCLNDTKSQDLFEVEISKKEISLELNVKISEIQSTSKDNNSSVDLCASVAEGLACQSVDDNLLVKLVDEQQNINQSIDNISQNELVDEEKNALQSVDDNLLDEPMDEEEIACQSIDEELTDKEEDNFQSADENLQDEFTDEDENTSQSANENLQDEFLDEEENTRQSADEDLQDEHMDEDENTYQSTDENLQDELTDGGNNICQSINTLNHEPVDEEENTSSLVITLVDDEPVGEEENTSPLVITLEDDELIEDTSLIKGEALQTLDYGSKNHSYKWKKGFKLRLKSRYFSSEKFETENNFRSQGCGTSKQDISLCVKNMFSASKKIKKKNDSLKLLNHYLKNILEVHPDFKKTLVGNFSHFHNRITNKFHFNIFIMNSKMFKVYNLSHNHLKHTNHRALTLYCKNDLFHRNVEKICVNNAVYFNSSKCCNLEECNGSKKLNSSSFKDLMVTPINIEELIPYESHICVEHNENSDTSTKDDLVWQPVTENYLLDNNSALTEDIFGQTSDGDELYKLLKHSQPSSEKAVEDDDIMSASLGDVNVQYSYDLDSDMSHEVKINEIGSTDISELENFCFPDNNISSTVYKELIPEEIEEDNAVNQADPSNQDLPDKDDSNVTNNDHDDDGDNVDDGNDNTEILSLLVQLIRRSRDFFRYLLQFGGMSNLLAELHRCKEKNFTQKKINEIENSLINYISVKDINEIETNLGTITLKDLVEIENFIDWYKKIKFGNSLPYDDYNMLNKVISNEDNNVSNYSVYDLKSEYEISDSKKCSHNLKSSVLNNYELSPKKTHKLNNMIDLGLKISDIANQLIFSDSENLDKNVKTNTVPPVLEENSKITIVHGANKILDLKLISQPDKKEGLFDKEGKQIYVFTEANGIKKLFIRGKLYFPPTICNDDCLSFDNAGTLTNSELR